MKEYNKTVCAMIIYFNDYLWLDSCIRNIYDHVDQIVVVEGMVELMQRAGAKFDGSGSKIISQISDPEDKIYFLKERIFKDKLEQRQAALDNCICDWVFIVDTDEFYKKNHLRKLRLEIDSVGRKCDMIIYPHLNFWDFEHYNLKNYMERVFKNSSGKIGYWGNPKDGQNIYKENVGKLWDKINFMQQGQAEFKFLDTIRCFHYSKMKDYKAAILRAKYYISRADRSLAGEKLDNVAKEWMRNHILSADLSKMTPYVLSEHPEIIKEHMFYEKYKSLKNCGKADSFLLEAMNIKGEFDV